MKLSFCYYPTKEFNFSKNHPSEFNYQAERCISVKLKFYFDFDKMIDKY
jgi:hypothetical protein